MLEHRVAGTPEIQLQRLVGVLSSRSGGLTRLVAVNYVDPDNLEDVDASETGVKRIIVSVVSGNKTLASLAADVTDY